MVLVNDGGTQEVVDLPVQVLPHTQFRHHGRTYQCYGTEMHLGAVVGICRQIADDNFGWYANVKPSLVEDELVAFFRARSESLSGRVTEPEIKRAVLAALAPYFRIRGEVWGVHVTGQRVGIDAVLQPNDPESWRSDGLAFGIEFKGTGGARGRGQGSVDALAQCVDYSCSRFPDVEKMLVFLCPVPMSLRKEDRLWRFAGRYNVGSVDFRNGEIVLRWCLQDVWSESRGLTPLGRRAEFAQRFGNRSLR